MWSLSLRARTGGALRSCSDCRNHSLLLGYPLWLLELMASKLCRLTSSVRVKSCETLWVWRTGPDVVQQWAEYLHYLWFGRQPCIGHSLISAWWRLVTLITHKVHAPGPMSIFGSVIDFLFIFHWLYQLLLSIQPLQNSHHHKTQVRRETPVRSQVLVGGRLNTRWVKEIRTSQVVRVLRRKKNTMKQWSMLGDSVRLCGPRQLSWNEQCSPRSQLMKRQTEGGDVDTCVACHPDLTLGLSSQCSLNHSVLSFHMPLPINFILNEVCFVRLL